MSTEIESLEELDLSKFFDRPWVTIVWDDPVNLQSYVTYVFIKLFGFSPNYPFIKGEIIH